MSFPRKRESIINSWIPPLLTQGQACPRKGGGCRMTPQVFEAFAEVSTYVRRFNTKLLGMDGFGDNFVNAIPYLFDFKGLAYKAGKYLLLQPFLYGGVVAVIIP